MVTVETANIVLEETSAELPGVAPGQYVRLSVRDTGVGMTEEVRVRAFERRVANLVGLISPLAGTDREQTEDLLRAALQRAAELADECAWMVSRVEPTPIGPPYVASSAAAA